jgi:hypothetical protein
LDAFEVQLPATVPEADVIVSTRKKINQVRKTPEKYGSNQLFGLEKKWNFRFMSLLARVPRLRGLSFLSLPAKPR